MIALPDPRYALLDEPTPLQRLARLERALGRSGLFVKRDDQMPIALGGNKLRSLEFWLGRALEEGADIALVAGGPNSNMCRLTAAAAAMAELDCIVFHNADSTPESRRMSFLNQVFGAEVRYLGEMDETLRAAEMERAASALRVGGRRPHIVGDPIIGALGYVRAAAELARQNEDLGGPIRHVFMPGSMGPTEAGFIFGNAVLGYPFEVHLVSVEYGRDELDDRIARILRGLASHTGLLTAGVDATHQQYHMDHLGAGYDQPTAAAEAAILRFARTEGVLLEHTYTAKTFAAFLDLAAAGGPPPEEGMCAIHTGGLPALFSQFDRFATRSAEAG
ncbi:pyridoxal-phosphate dependent enzyme [Pikeienuella piscinae]|uniref:Pyridoxal-phosphate dependent enzyme n=1 Tax=Pikeienuella piscinae TaxID=2748098 RepID=A0A7L5BX08_9RHOB|nr:pyridoxal-phosphate dependent enzyme [Pikeienuella piscinae]QIE55067.1 pyridoxal-phosphate dependent enzyme [Pikeienuella piscinae]